MKIRKIFSITIGLFVLIILVLVKPDKITAQAECIDIAGGGIPESCENHDVSIKAGAMVTSDIFDEEKQRVFSNLTIKNNATLTHRDLASGDLEKLIAAKKVNIKVTGKLTMEADSKIDVNGKGYWSSQNHVIGVPRGGPPGTSAAGWGGTGGGNGGQGGGANDSSGHSYYFNGYNQKLLTYNGNYHGAGGSSSLAVDKGGRGGGVVIIDAGEMEFSDTATIVANGNGTGNNRSAGGAGGFIFLKAETYSTSADFGKVQVTGGPSSGGWGSYGPGEDGVAPIAEFYGGGNFQAKGGADESAGGGGGIIKVEFSHIDGPDDVCPSDLGERDYIPAICGENDRVVIPAGKTVYADKIRIDSNGNECDNQNYSLCDSKRTFKSLTILGDPNPGGAGIGKLTHEAINRFEMATENTNANTNNPGNKSLADEGHGTARWKKVDIAATESVFLNHGNIDVSGKGYPGAYWTGQVSGERNVVYGLGWSSEGCSGDNTGHLVGANGVLSQSDDNFEKNYGFGPGGGIAFRQKGDSSGGGGGFGGQGKIGFNFAGADGSGVYNPAVGNIRLEWGSGGGGVSYDFGVDNTTCANGGAGGGIINLATNQFIKDGASYGLITNGVNGLMFQNDGNSMGAGGGAGGVIVLRTNSYNITGGSSSPDVSGGMEAGTKGRIVDASDLNAPQDIPLGDLAVLDDNLPVLSARGGHHSNSDSGGCNMSNHTGVCNRANAAGGGGGWIALGGIPGGPGTPPQKGNVKVIVTWEELGQEQTVEMFTWLRDVRVQ